MTSVVTVDEFASLRRRREDLVAVTVGLAQLGHNVPADAATELDALDGAVVDVVIRCLLNGRFGTCPAGVDGEGTLHAAAICGQCDRAVSDGVRDEIEG